MMEGQIVENDEMREIINDFVIESSELVENVIQDIVAIEENPDEEAINGIFRAVHTVKGTSSFLGFGILSNLAHKAEDLLGMIRKGEIKIDKEIADTLLEALDLIKSMIEDIKTKGTDDRDTTEVVGKLERLAKVEKKKLGEPFS